MQTFHSLLAARWFESLKPIVLSNCSYWRGEEIEMYIWKHRISGGGYNNSKKLLLTEIKQGNQGGGLGLELW